MGVCERVCTHVVIHDTALSGEVLGIVTLGGGRLQQSRLLTEDACAAPVGSFPDCVLWDVNRY